METAHLSHFLTELLEGHGCIQAGDQDVPGAKRVDMCHQEVHLNQIKYWLIELLITQREIFPNKISQPPPTPANRTTGHSLVF